MGAETVGYKKGQPILVNTVDVIVVGDKVSCLETECPVLNCPKKAVITEVRNKRDRGLMSEREGDGVVKPQPVITP